MAGWQQAKIENKDTQKVIECWFNPKEYTVKKTNTWEVKPVPGKGLPSAQFTGSNSQTISLALIFDAGHAGVDDVRGVTGELLKLMEVSQQMSSDGNKGRPPIVTFSWGSNLHFDAVITSLSVQYMTFSMEGEPTRAQASIELTQVGSATYKGYKPPKQGGKKQNPTTRGIAGLSSHVVRDGDTLQSISWHQYRDPTRWRVIAEANDIDDPLRLRRGAVLSVPRLES